MTSAAFSPDGARIVTASHDMTARIWDVARTGLISQAGEALLAGTLAHGIGQRSADEANDLLMEEAPDDLFAAALEYLSPDQHAEVKRLARALAAPHHPNCYLSTTQQAEKSGLTAPQADDAPADTEQDDPTAETEEDDTPDNTQPEPPPAEPEAPPDPEPAEQPDAPTAKKRRRWPFGKRR